MTADGDHLSGDAMSAVQRGLRMAQPPDPDRLAAEKALLADLEGQSWGTRTGAYFRLIGPGYMQSAMTLGSGSAAASLFAGAVFGYQLLWVGPVAMALGVIVLAAVSHQTLSTGREPLQAMREHAGPFFAVGWAVAALLSSVIWHLPQYNLAAATLFDLGTVAGAVDAPADGAGPASGSLVAASAVCLAWAVSVSLLYGRSARWIRIYERLIKHMVWGIVLCFGWVVVNTSTDWAGVAAGFVPFQFPESNSDVSSIEVAVAALAAAVGVNMLFLYPYSLLARGWGREHRRLARFDLLSGMLVPYALATSLMVIATANTLHADGIEVKKNVAIATAANVLGSPEAMGAWGRVVFDLGILGMALSSITLHMQVCGFVATRWLGVEVGSKGYFWATMLPTPAFLAPLVWGKYAVSLALPTTIICGALMPLVYVAFIRMQASSAFLGADRPRGAKGMLWIAGMVLATVVLLAGLGLYLWDKFGTA